MIARDSRRLAEISFLYFPWMFCARITQSAAAAICGSRDHMGNMWMEINPVGRRERNLDRDQRLASFHSFLPLFTILSKFGILWDLFFYSQRKEWNKSDCDFLPFFNPRDVICSVVTLDHLNSQLRGPFSVKNIVHWLDILLYLLKLSL